MFPLPENLKQRKILLKNNLKTKIISTVVIFVLVAADQGIKVLVDLYLRPIGSKMLIPGFLQLRYLENDGAMMGMMGGKTTVMTILAVVCMIAVLVVIYSGWLTSKVDYISVVLIAAGGFGNIIDRIFRGFVIDYIEALFVDFYVFNFADCLITCAAFTIIIYQIYCLLKDRKTKKEIQ